MHSIILCDSQEVVAAADAIELKYDAIIKVFIEFFPLLECFTAWNIFLESKFEICAKCPQGSFGFIVLFTQHCR